jgi:hypothetical protein
MCSPGLIHRFCVELRTLVQMRFKNTSKISHKNVHTLQPSASANQYTDNTLCLHRFEWPRDLRRRSVAVRLLGLWVRIPPETLMSVSCKWCVLSGRALYDELITRPEESYRLCCVVICNLETSIMRRQWPVLGRSVTEGKSNVTHNRVLRR